MNVKYKLHIAYMVCRKILTTDAAQKATIREYEEKIEFLTNEMAKVR